MLWCSRAISGRGNRVVDEVLDLFLPELDYYQYLLTVRSLTLSLDWWLGSTKKVQSITNCGPEVEGV